MRTNCIEKTMKEFCVAIAEITVGVRAEYSKILEQCEEYLNDEKPDFWVSVSPADIARMRESALREDALEGKETQNYGDAYLETLAVYRMICEKMVDYDTILMHGSTIAVDGQAFLFTAKSGTGKSTHTRLWREMMGDRAEMVNDDKPLLKLTEDGVLACGTPWNGKHGLGSNIMVPLKAICILERGETNEITRISAQEALPMVLQQTYRPRNLAKYLDIIDKLTQRVRFYRLRCNIRPEAAVVAYEGMKE